MSAGIRLIVGLGNPGQQYQDTRHNAGAWFLDRLCVSTNTSLSPDTKVYGNAGRTQVDGYDLRLLFPTTYMNRSGQAVSAICKYFKISPEEVLVAYDDLDLPTGTVRFKSGGGHGGHNGIRDIISALGTPGFQRLRIGIGHPGDSSKVLDYVLGNPGRQDREAIEDAIARALQVLRLFCTGNSQAAMNKLHTKV